MTDLYGAVYTETTVELHDSPETSITVNGKPASGARAQGMHDIVELMLDKADVDTGFKIASVNHNVVTGSSDSGAAALITALNEILELNLSIEELLWISCRGSETVFRSLVGGLTEYVVDDPHRPRAEPIAKASELGDVIIYAVPFTGMRFTADQIHSAVVKHPDHGGRAGVVAERIKEFKKSIKEKNYSRAFDLMECDARDVHWMFSEVGFKVINDDMQELCSYVEQLRREGMPAYWNVAGGNQVYVFTTQEYSSNVADRLKEKWGYTIYRIAGPSEVV